MFLTPAVASGCISEISTPAGATGGAFGVVKAFPALSGPAVARFRVRHVYVVVALARLAAASRLRGVAIVTWSTFLTSGT